MFSKKQTKDPFSNKVRVRACGILKENEQILLLKHNSIGKNGYLWSPPGGGVAFGQRIEDCLKREFIEETNLSVTVEKYLFTNEFIGERHHAIEHFFLVRRLSGTLRLGSDPELPPDQQMLTKVKFFAKDELLNLPEYALHQAFYEAESPDKIEELHGFFTFTH